MAPTVHTPPINTYVPLESIVLTNAASSITFFNIAQSDADGTYKDLVLVINGKNSTTGADSAIIRFNNDSGNNYSNVRMVGTGSATSSYADTTSACYIGVPTNSSNLFTITTQIQDFTATDKHKTLLSRHSQDNGWVTAHAGRWANTTAITALTIAVPSGSTWTYSAGTTLSLYALHG